MTVTAEATFAFVAGIATFFSPCVFALLPGYVGYYVSAVERETAPLSGALARGIAASLGALGTFALLSVGALMAGQTLERLLADVIEPLIGGLLVLFGLLVLWKGALSFTVMLPERRADVFGFGLFGAMYAMAATACVLPLFLSVAVASIDLSVAGTTLVLGAYAGGFAVLMLSATVAVAIGQEALFSRMAGHAPLLTRVAGVVLVLAGLLQLYIAFWVGPIDPLSL